MAHYVLKLTKRDRRRMTLTGAAALLGFLVCYTLFWTGGRRTTAVGFIAAVTLLGAIGALLGLTEWIHLPTGDRVVLTAEQREKSILRVSRYGAFMTVCQLAALIAGLVTGGVSVSLLWLGLGAVCSGVLTAVYAMIGKACDPA